MDVAKIREVIEAALHVAVDRGYTIVRKGFLNSDKKCCAMGAVAVASAANSDNFEASLDRARFDGAMYLAGLDEDNVWSFISGFDNYNYFDHVDVPELRALGDELRVKWVKEVT